MPAIDAHNHLGRWLGLWDDWLASTPPSSCAARERPWACADVGALIATLDEVGVEAIVNLDGLWGDELERNLDRYDRAHPGRFLTFCHVDLRAIGGQASTRGTRREPAALERRRRTGSQDLEGPGPQHP